MITVIAKRITKKPEYEVHQHTVKVNGFNNLTPKAARAALEIAFGNANSGEVIDRRAGYGYRVYAKSARKIQLDY